ncbi:MAG: Lsr2 family DNA-binding protein [Mycobacteriaceae bacterium]
MVRSWAHEQGIQVADRGRIPRSVMQPPWRRSGRRCRSARSPSSSATASLPGSYLTARLAQWVRGLPAARSVAGPGDRKANRSRRGSKGGRPPHFDAEK